MKGFVSKSFWKDPFLSLCMRTYTRANIACDYHYIITYACLDVWMCGHALVCIYMFNLNLLYICILLSPSPSPLPLPSRRERRGAWGPCTCLSSLKLLIHLRFDLLCFFYFFLVRYSILLLKGDVFFLLSHFSLQIWYGSGIRKKLRGVAARMAQNWGIVECFFCWFWCFVAKK